MLAIDTSTPPTPYDILGAVSFTQGVLTFLGVAILTAMAATQQVRSQCRPTPLSDSHVRFA